MKRRTSELRYAVFDTRSRRLKGDFTTEDAAWEWFDKHPPIRILDPEGREVGRVPTAFEADLILQQHPGHAKEREGRERYRVYYDLNLS